MLGWTWIERVVLDESDDGGADDGEADDSETDDGEADDGEADDNSGGSLGKGEADVRGLDEEELEGLLLSPFIVSSVIPEDHFVSTPSRPNLDGFPPDAWTPSFSLEKDGIT